MAKLIDERWTLKLGDPDKREMSTIVRRKDKSFVIGYAMREWFNKAAQAEDDQRGKAMAAAPELLNAVMCLLDAISNLSDSARQEFDEKAVKIAIAAAERVTK